MTRRNSLCFLQRLRGDQTGATIVEFAVIAPVMSVLLLGAFDIAHTLYMRAALQGVVQKTARDSTLEDASESATQLALDAKVMTQAKALANNAQVSITRRYYRTFSDASAARAETWTDTDHDGTCNNGEPYEDANRNGTWDKDGGDGGQGGAKDAVLYTVQVRYPHMFPIYQVIGGSTQATVTASTVLKNQPYGDQGTYGAPVVRNCP